MPEPKIAESWDDGDEPDLSASLARAAADSSRPKLARPKTSDYPSPPPPTPASPSAAFAGHVSSQQQGASSAHVDEFLHPSQRAAAAGQPQKSRPDVRPEKTMAAASRMIAAGLGVPPPKRTEQQRQYDKAMMDNERKAREEKREAKRRDEEERESAQKAMWDD